MKKVKLASIASIRTGFQIRAKLTPVDKGTHNVVQMRNIRTDTGEIIEGVEFCRVTPKESRLDGYLLKKGDVLFLTRGNNHPATLITEKYVGFVAAGQFMVLSLNGGECLSEYLRWFLNSPESRSYFAREARGTAVKIVDKSTVGNLEISIPDLRRQKAIVALYDLSKREEKLLNSLMIKRKRLIHGYCHKAGATDEHGF